MTVETQDVRLTRRNVLQAAAAGLLAGAIPLRWAAGQKTPTRKLLFFTKSAGFQHSVVKRPKPDELAYAEQIMVDFGKAHGFDVTATKDGGFFTPEKLAEYDAVAFYTTGPLDQP